MVKRRDTVILERRYVPKGKIIITEGDYGAQAYLIQSGRVRVYIEQGDKQVELAILGTGEIFGEMALIFDGPRTASVEVIDDANLIMITRNQFEDKLKGTDSTIRSVVHMLARRILDVNNSLINKKSNLAAMKETGRVMYQNISAGLTPAQQRVFAKNVLPKLDALIHSIEEFEDSLHSSSD